MTISARNLAMSARELELTLHFMVKNELMKTFRLMARCAIHLIVFDKLISVNVFMARLTCNAPALECVDDLPGNALTVTFVA